MDDKEAAIAASRSLTTGVGLDVARDAAMAASSCASPANRPPEELFSSLLLWMAATVLVSAASAATRGSTCGVGRGVAVPLLDATTCWVATKVEWWSQAAARSADAALVASAEDNGMGCPHPTSASACSWPGPCSAAATSAGVWLWLLVVVLPGGAGSSWRVGSSVLPFSPPVSFLASAGSQSGSSSGKSSPGMLVVVLLAPPLVLVPDGSRSGSIG
mmetsp:Transcript_668/g.2101  ORF Transcript_668/g.2101 Transcript_668/m.2101 type:complete len:217 (-) Transcript_668:42-692(-)